MFRRLGNPLEFWNGSFGSFLNHPRCHPRAEEGIVIIIVVTWVSWSWWIQIGLLSFHSPTDGDIQFL